MKCIDFYISYRCNNKCIFCTQAYSIEKFKNHPPLEFKRIISILQEKKKDFNSVNFTGGEPTLYRDFVPLVKAAKKLGYKIYVGTNGGRFADKGFCEEAAPFIADVCFSCHGHTDRLHNLHTRNPNSFQILTKAMDNLSDFPVFFSNNTVITKYNLSCLGNILALLSKKRIKQALFSNLSPAGKGIENYQSLAVSFGAIKNNISGLVRLAKQKKIILSFCDVPSCILRNYDRHSVDFPQEERVSIKYEQNNGIFFLKAERPSFPDCRKMKIEKCISCFYNDSCEGFFREYYLLFRDTAIKKV